MAEPGPPLLEVRGLSKRFPGVQALDGVRLDLCRGEVLAVIGENGAGKSTLMKILAGIERPDAGRIALAGREVVIDGVAAATSLGIALIHQELNLPDNLDVGASIYLGREPLRWGPLRFVDRRRIARDAEVILARLGMRCSPRATVGSLSIGQQQMVEIAKALSVNARILIMDEPTSSLSQKETQALFDVVRGLRAQGVSVVYISHRLGEVKEIADRVTVLRDGRNAGELRRDEIAPARMVSLMVGRDMVQFYPHTAHITPLPLFEVRGLVVPGLAGEPVSFTVRAGEIVGLAGLVGAGRTELAQALFGIRKPSAGALRVAGAEVRLETPRDAIRAGIALVPEDRKLQGLVLEMTVRENITLAGLSRYARAGLVRRRPERAAAGDLVRLLGVRTPDVEREVRYLSGGNQQKVVLAKWLALRPRVLLLDEPTRGIDVVAKEEIYRLMEDLAASGIAILMISSEMQEVLGMSDRVLVMHQGRLAGELARDELSEEAVMRLATGGAAA